MIFLFIIIFILITILHTYLIAFMGLLFGVYIDKISIGMGPTLLAYGRLEIGAIPLGGYVKFSGMEDSASMGEIVEPIEGFFFYKDIPRWQKIVMSLIAPVVIFLIGFLLVGDGSFAICLDAMKVATLSAWGPLSYAQDVIADAVNFIDHSSVVSLAGYTCISVAAVNLLPLPVLNGGAALFELLHYEKWPKNSGEILWTFLCWVGLLCLFLWIISIMWYLCSSVITGM